jgi:nitroreductase
MDRLPASISEYHQRTKHAVQRYAAGPSFLDWDRQPDPFRRFDGARTVPLPVCMNAATPAFGELGHAQRRPLNAESLGLFLELALGLSAWKEVPGGRWAVRNNPSSGNLHPTEAWLALPPLPEIGGAPALYHYAPFGHALEERCVFGEPRPALDGGFFLALSSILWREAWKYGERAYRYCLLDAGHALAACTYAAGCLGWRVQLCAGTGDDVLKTCLGLDQPGAMHAREEEFPELTAYIRTNGMQTPPLAVEPWRGQWSGTPSRLSEEHEPWLAAIRAAALAHKPGTLAPDAPPPANAPLFPGSSEPASAIIRRRRSVQRMDGQTSLPLPAFERMLAATMPQPDAVPWQAYPWEARLALFIFVHRVDGLPPGLYALPRAPGMLERLKAACDPAFLWEPAPGTSLPLYILRPGNFQRFASALCCHQAIAGHGAFSLGMLADFSRTLDAEGDWAYRRLFWEAGMIGQVLYLEAAAAGISGTGIGCFFDDDMHRLLGLPADSMNWQSLYHFTAGGGFEDSRVSTSPPYAHLPADRFR